MVAPATITRNVQKDKPLIIAVKPNESVTKIRVTTKLVNGRLVAEYERIEGADCEIFKEQVA